MSTWAFLAFAEVINDFGRIPCDVARVVIWHAKWRQSRQLATLALRRVSHSRNTEAAGRRGDDPAGEGVSEQFMGRGIRISLPSKPK